MGKVVSGKRGEVRIRGKGVNYHFCETTSCDDVAGVYEAVEVTSRFFDDFSHVIVTVKVEDVGDKIKGILVVLDLCLEASEIETVGEVFLIDLAEVFVAPGGYEL